MLLNINVIVYTSVNTISNFQQTYRNMLYMVIEKSIQHWEFNLFACFW